MRLSRDPYGIPHLWGDDLLDLARLQGRVTAHDRAWQIAWHHQRGTGRVAEWLGEDGVPWDVFARRARIADTARRAFDRLDTETAAFLTAYADGVNAVLPAAFPDSEEARGLALATCPPWQPWSPLIVFEVVHILFGSFGDKLWRARAADVLGDDHVDLLRCAEDGSEFEPSSGSNAWALAGTRTRSGRPLVAGDSHRTLEVPNAYQQVRLACPEFDVAGFTFPGVPGVQHFAHTGEVAWGITNASADYQDLYREHLREDGDTLTASGPDGPEPVTVTAERIQVRDGTPVQVRCLETRRGPVVLDEPAPMSLATPSRRLADLGFAALLPLLRSRTTADVESALASWVQPVNSVLTADVHGSVRHLVVGRVPRRSEEALKLPVDAADPHHAWTGWACAPAEDVLDFAANANDQASSGDLGWSYAPPHRAERLRDLLAQRGPSGPAEQADLHRDALAGQARTMQDLVRLSAPRSAAGRELASALLAWDRRMDPQSHEALVFSRWRLALVDRLLALPSFGELAHDPGGPAAFVASTRDRFIAAWERLVDGRAADLGIDVPAAVAGALDDVAAAPDEATVWGEVHRFAPLHGLDAYRADLVPAVPRAHLGGDRDCVWATYSKAGGAEGVAAGSVARYVWDLADRAASLWAVPMGASGRHGDAHFADQLPFWSTCTLVPVLPDESELTPVEVP